jgi:hypothetical protein
VNDKKKNKNRLLIFFLLVLAELEEKTAYLS